MTSEHVVMANLGEEKKDAIDKIIAAPAPPKAKSEIVVQPGGEVQMKTKVGVSIPNEGSSA
jgi:6-phosphogluconolactonase/glucosamine-6-phosphate isomerase/deaminase